MALTPDQVEFAKKLLRIFFPYLTANRERMIEEGGRFVHYTTAENALKILKTKSFWMRNATCMSDYQEVQHGYGVIDRYLRKNRDKFDSALNSCVSDIAVEALKLFDQWWQNIQTQTYIASISEHDRSEDIHGRLSMWRAFGGAATARVAIIMNLPLAVGINEGLGALFTPVGYFSDEVASRELDAVLDNISANQQFLKTVDRNIFLRTIFMLLMTNVVSMKHEGFREEKEWRIIHVPKVLITSHIDSSVEVVGGVPQRVYKIPLRNNAETGVVGIDLRELFHGLIVGPSQFPLAMVDAFVTVLEEAGIQNAASRISFSRIPVRT
jgi:hypothetical protein